MDQIALEREAVVRCLTHPAGTRDVLASLPGCAFLDPRLRWVWEQLQALADRPEGASRDQALLALIAAPMDDGTRAWLARSINDLYEEAITTAGAAAAVSALRRAWGESQLRELLLDQAHRVREGEDPFLAVRTLQARLKELVLNG